MKNTLARSMVQIVLLLQPLSIATTTFMVYRGAKIDNFAAYVILGGGLAGVWSAITFSSAGDINRERNMGTLQPMLISPASIPLIFTAKITANALLSLLALAMSLVYSVIILNVEFQVTHGWAFALSLAAFLFGASAFALCLSSLFLLSRSTAIMQNFLEYPLLLLGGLAFPVWVLPSWAQSISAALPIRWGSEALRYAMSSNPLDSGFWLALGWTVVVGVTYYIAALLLFKRIEFRVRANASLELI
jgi:ABC-2 type transport system permease protein